MSCSALDFVHRRIFFSFNTLVDSKRQLDMYKADMELYYTNSLED